MQPIVNRWALCSDHGWNDCVQRRTYRSNGGVAVGAYPAACRRRHFERRRRVVERKETLLNSGPARISSGVCPAVTFTGQRDSRVDDGEHPLRRRNLHATDKRHHDRG